MKKNGFTLIELLGVIIILALLIILVFPSIINSIKKTSGKIDDLTLELVYSAADAYIAKHKSAFPKKNGNKYAIALQELVDDGLLISPIKSANNDEDLTKLKSVQVTYYNGFNYELKDNESIEWFNIKTPNLYKGVLVPVVYNGDNWEIVSLDSDWYNYKKQEWANAVILNDNVSRKVGYELNLQTDVKAMFVYIPRYEYKIEGDYGKNGTSSTTPGEIDINFISKEKINASEGYTIAPAFKIGEDELDGIWVGKFEVSALEGTDFDVFSCLDDECTTSKNLRILPNATALYNGSISMFYNLIKFINIEGNGYDLKTANAHIIKNSEWVAVAYLSQSKYGKYGNPNYQGANKEIYQNKSYEYRTGSSNGTPSQDKVEYQCEYDNTTNNCGVGASTTGNITGIYDMSGGAAEYVMGIYNNQEVGNEDLNLLDPKYFDIYTNYENSKLGHGFIEISSSSTGNTSWYNDYSMFFTSENNWLVRGGLYSDDVSAGIFAFKNDSGDQSWGEVVGDRYINHADNYNTTRVVLTLDY